MIIYIDDILVYFQMTKEHAKHLEYVWSISNWSTFPLYNTPITMLQLYKRTRFNGNLSMKFCTCKNITMKKNLLL